MAICTGQGDPNQDGCCYIFGQVCPNRLLFVPDGSGDWLNYDVVDSDGVSLGTLDDYMKSQFGLNAKPGRQKAEKQLHGRLWACNIVGLVMAADTSLLPDNQGNFTAAQKSALNLAWYNHPDYSTMREYWDDYCMSYGPNEQQCCWNPEDPEPGRDQMDIEAVAVAVRTPGAS